MNRHDAKELATSMRRLAGIAMLSTASAMVGPARAQSPSIDGGDEVTKLDSVANAVPSAYAAGTLPDAGVATRNRELRAPLRFEGTFTQTRQAATTGGARYGFSTSAAHAIAGTLVWTRDDRPGHPKTFGDVDSQFYVPTDGELKVDVKLETRSDAGTCSRAGSKTFAVRGLPPAALQNLYLEVAADGRYKMKLAMISYFLQVEAVQRCTFKVDSETREVAVPINAVGVVIGPQQGVITGDAIAGATEQAVVYGVHSYSGQWDFKEVND